MTRQVRNGSVARLTIVLCAVLPPPALAASPEDEPDPKELRTKAEPVEELDDQATVGRRRPETSFRSARSISSVDAEELAESSPRSTPEALHDAPGVFVQHTNHGGGSPILRGMIGPQVLILVDGVRLNNSVYRTGPLQYLNLLDANMLDRVEVLRGPGSVLYGSDAMGGVIEAFSLTPRGFEDQPEAPVGGRARLRFASANQGLSFHGLLDARPSGVGLLAAVTYKSYGDLRGGGEVGEQVHSGYDNWSVLARLVHRFEGGLTDGWELSAGYLSARIDDAGRTDKLFDKRSLQIYDNEDHLAYARLRFDIPSLATSGQLTASFQSFSERKDNHQMADDLVERLSTTRDETEVLTGAVDLELVSELWRGHLRAMLGGMYYHDSVSATRQARLAGAAWETQPDNAYPSGSGYENWGLFLMLEGSFLEPERPHLLQLDAGYRLHGMGGQAPSQAGLPAVDFDHLGHVFHAALRYAYRDLFATSLAFSQGFRSPNLQEAVMLGDTGKFFHVPNAGLAPERSDTFELSARLRLWRVHLAATGYVSLLSDLIKRVETTWDGQLEVDGKPVYRNENGQEGTVYGAETELGLDFGYGLSLSGHLTYTYGEELIAGGGDVPLSRIPPLFGTARLRWESPEIGVWGVTAELSVRAAAKQSRLSPEDEKDARIPDGGTPGWWTLNVRLGVRMRRHFRATLAVTNLLDQAYKYHASGVYAAGTEVLVAVEGAY